MVNTGSLPRNTFNERVCAADLLLPAQDALFGFPLFKRFYPGNFSRFALALFLGKPAILVAHHDFFRNGTQGIEAFAQALRASCPAIRWCAIDELATTTHLRRRLSRDCTAIRFFTHRFSFTPDVNLSTHFRLSKRVDSQTAISRVLVNGKAADFSCDSDIVTFEIRVDRPQPCILEVESAPIRQTRLYSFGPLYHARVATRRWLSELRDDLICRNRHASKLANSAARALRLTTNTRSQANDTIPKGGSSSPTASVTAAMEQE